MSALEDAFKRRDEAKVRYLRDFLKVGGRKTSLAAFGMSDVSEYLPPDQRLAVGVAFGASEEQRDAPGLAIRVSKRDGIAERAAKSLAEQAEKDGSWADVRVVENLSVPARGDVARLAKASDDARSSEDPPAGAIVAGSPAAIKAGKAFPIGGDPLMLGVSVGHPRSPAGSLGGFITFKGGGEGIISACHILANGGRGIDPTQLDSDDTAPKVYHPASADLAGRLSPRHQIGRLHSFLSLETTSVELDVAVARLLPNRAHIGNVIPKILGAKNVGQPVLRPPASEQVARFKTVAKIGRTTHYTVGRLSSGFYDDIGLDVPGHGLVYYNRLFEIESEASDTPFALPGDSGAVVFDTATRAAFAMVVGGGEWDDKGRIRMLIYACNLAAALDAMDAEWM